MAGQAEKKRAKNAEETIKYYQYALAFFSAWYVLLRMFYQWDSFTFWPSLGCVALTMVTSFCYNAIDRNLKLGVEYTTTQDILFVNWFVQFACVFTDYVWYVYLVVPAYAVYALWGFIGPFIFGTSSGGSGSSSAPKKSNKYQMHG